MFSWKKIVLASIVGSCLSSGIGFAAWEEKEVVPVEYQKIEYKAEGELFWLQKPGEKKAATYYQLKHGMKQLPEGVELDSRELASSYYSYDGYEKNVGNSFIQVQDATDKSQKGLLRGDGSLEIPLGKYGNNYIYFTDGYVLGKNEIFKDGQKVGTIKNVLRGSNAPDVWFDEKKKKEVYDHTGEPLVKPEFSAEIYYYHSEMVIAKSDGKDKRPKRVRIWTSDGKEITPVAEGFKDCLLLEKRIETSGNVTYEIDGIFARHEKDEWKYYPYQGKGQFGEPILIKCNEHFFVSARQVDQGFYRLGRTQDDGDYLLDIEAQTVHKYANGLREVDGKRYYTKQRWSAGTFFVPYFSHMMGGFTAGIFSVNMDTGHFIQIRDDKGEEITTLWEAVYLGERFALNRFRKETKMISYDGTVIRNFKTPQDGYFPLVGHHDAPEQQEGQPRVVGVTSWENWPGYGRYQPYYRYGEWSIMDIQTGKEHLMDSEERFGRIIKVSDDGNTFWSLIEEGKGKERRYGIKRFEWK